MWEMHEMCHPGFSLWAQLETAATNSDTLAQKKNIRETRRPGGIAVWFLRKQVGLSDFAISKKSGAYKGGS